MALDVFGNLFFSLVDLFRGSVFVAIPVFILAVLGRWVNSGVRQRTGWGWVFSALSSTFIVVFFLVLFAYFIPVLDGLRSQSIGEVPSAFAPSLGAILASYAYGIVKVVAAALVVSLLLMPLEFVGLYIFEAISRRFPKANPLVPLLVTCYLAAVVSAAVILFIVPEVVTGILYFVYFGFT